MSLKDIDSILKDDPIDESQDYPVESSTAHLNFTCPNCGNLDTEDVIFLCNRCDAKQMINVANVNMCPNCLKQGENFMCLKCDSKQVKLKNSIDSLI